MHLKLHPRQFVQTYALEKRFILIIYNDQLYKITTTKPVRKVYQTTNYVHGCNTVVTKNDISQNLCFLTSSSTSITPAISSIIDKQPCAFHVHTALALPVDLCSFRFIFILDISKTVWKNIKFKRLSEKNKQAIKKMLQDKVDILQFILPCVAVSWNADIGSSPKRLKQAVLGNIFGYTLHK